jgi:hypothetical protein
MLPVLDIVSPDAWNPKVSGLSPRCGILGRFFLLLIQFIDLLSPQMLGFNVSDCSPHVEKLKINQWLFNVWFKLVIERPTTYFFFQGWAPCRMTVYLCTMYIALYLTPSESMRIVADLISGRSD